MRMQPRRKCTARWRWKTRIAPTCANAWQRLAPAPRRSYGLVLENDNEEAGANPGRAISAAPGFSSLPVTVQDGKIGLSAVALDPGGRVFAVCCPPPSPSASRQKTEGPVPHWQNGSIWIGSVTRSDPDFELAGSAPPSTASHPDSSSAARLLLVFCPGRNLLAACDDCGECSLYGNLISPPTNRSFMRHSRHAAPARNAWQSARMGDGWPKAAKTAKYGCGKFAPPHGRKPWPGHEGTVSALAFSANGQRLASGGWDHTVRVWKAQGSANARRRAKQEPPFCCLCLSPFAIRPFVYSAQA